MVDVARLPGPLERPEHSFSGRAVDVLREMVLSGQLRAGERVNEVELANALGISRGPLREAIQRLRSEGLLTAVSGRGAFVRTFTPDALRDLYEVRIALEAHAVRLAAERLGPEGIQELRQLLDLTDESLASEHTYPQDLDFHQRMIALADNQALLDTATEIHRQIHLARSRSGHVSVRAKAALAEHREVLDHLAEGRGAEAARVLTDHLRLSLENAIEVLYRTGGAEVGLDDGSSPEGQRLALS